MKVAVVNGCLGAPPAVLRKVFKTWDVSPDFGVRMVRKS
jgi:hypothetical protein